MKSRKTQFGIIFTLTSLLVVGLVAITGCKKEPAPTPPEETEETVSATIEQTVCPVMAGPVNKDIFTEYKGKKIYFCCAACKTRFEEAPEKYLTKLPQFKE